MESTFRTHSVACEGVDANLQDEGTNEARNAGTDVETGVVTCADVDVGYVELETQSVARTCRISGSVEQRTLSIGGGHGGMENQEVEEVGQIEAKGCERAKHGGLERVVESAQLV